MTEELLEKALKISTIFVENRNRLSLIPVKHFLEVVGFSLFWMSMEPVEIIFGDEETEFIFAEEDSGSFVLFSRGRQIYN